MKRVTIILLICIYSFSILGIGIRQFYCCGKLKSTDITFIQEAKEKCGMAKGMNGCCQYKFKSFKLKDSHIAADGIATKYFSPSPIITPSFAIITWVNQPMEIANTSHAPPPHPNIPLYILYRVYRI